MIETYIGIKKSDWLKYLKTYYSQYRTRLKEVYPMEKLKSDNKLELQSYKINKWMQKKGINFKSFALYLQEQNGISKKTRQIIMDMIRTIILKRDINNNLRPKLILVIIYMKNNWSTKAL